MNSKQLRQTVHTGQLDDRLAYFYGEAAVPEQKARYLSAIDAFEARYGERDVMIFSVPGRTEVSGNHTDHNYGRVIAAAVDRDVIAVVAKRDDEAVRVKSEGYPEDVVSLSSPSKPGKMGYFTSKALIEGVIAGMKARGYAVCGFDAYTTSNVRKGSGISSSAAFEVLLGKILSVLAAKDAVPHPELARIAQYAENVYFGKPSGLMDQTACAVGAFITIDFADPEQAVIEQIPFDLEKAGYALCVTYTGGNHANLNDDYAAIPAEMKAVAAHFGKQVLRQITMEELMGEIPALREKTGDRAILRAIHYLNENKRVGALVDALKAGDVESFLAGVNASGASSFQYLQNVYTNANVAEQGISLALAVSDQLLAGKKAAWRVHGGGFAGTVQAFVPLADVPAYCEGMNAVFGKDACSVFRIRPEGAAVVVGV